MNCPVCLNPATAPAITGTDLLFETTSRTFTLDSCPACRCLFLNPTIPAIHRAKRKFLERVNYFGQDASLDGQGRVLIPQILRDAAKLPADVVVTGNIDHLVVSDRGALSSRLSSEDFTAEDYDELSKLLMSSRSREL